MFERAHTVNTVSGAPGSPRLARLPFACALETLAITMGLCLALSLFAPGASGHGGARGIVLERHKSMIKLERAGKALHAMAEAKRAINRKQLKRQARVMVTEAGRMHSQFPDTRKSRRGKGSRASPLIWTERTEFDLMADDLTALAKALRADAARISKQKLRASVEAMGRSCDTCHVRYRMSKKLAH